MLQGILGSVIGWIVSFAILCAIVLGGWWVLTHPETAAHVVLTVINGVVSFVSAIISGIGSLFARL